MAQYYDLQTCPRDYLQTSVTFSCPQAKELLTLNSDSAHTVQCQLSAVLERGFMASLQNLSSLKHQEGLMRSKALHLVEVLFRQP